MLPHGAFAENMEIWKLYEKKLIYIPLTVSEKPFFLVLPLEPNLIVRFGPLEFMFLYFLGTLDPHMVTYLKRF